MQTLKKNGRKDWIRIKRKRKKDRIGKGIEGRKTEGKKEKEEEREDQIEKEKKVREGKKKLLNK